MDVPTLDLQELNAWYTPVNGDLIRQNDEHFTPTVYVASRMTYPDGWQPDATTLPFLNTAAEVFRRRGFRVYNPAEITPPSSDHDAASVYLINHRKVACSDLIFFIRAYPSLGMGIEAQIAADALVPWTQAKTVSRAHEQSPLLAGLANPRAHSLDIRFESQNLADFDRKLETQLDWEDLYRVAHHHHMKRHRALQSIVEMDLGFAIRRQRLLYNMSLDYVAHHCGVSTYWISSIEKHDDAAATLSLTQIYQLMSVTRCQFRSSQNAATLFLPEIVPVERFSKELFDAAHRYAKKTVECDRASSGAHSSDNEMLRDWKAWAKTYAGASVQGVGPKTPALKRPKFNVHILVPISNVDKVQQERLSNIRDMLCAALKERDDIDSVTDPADTQNHIPSGRSDFGDQLYARGLTRLPKHDIIIVLADPPATGVGVMTEAAANLCIPRICLVPQGKVLSRMFRGTFSISPGDYHCYGPEDVSSLISRILDENQGILSQSLPSRRQVVQSVTENNLTRTIFRYIIPRGLTIEEFASQLGVSPNWLYNLAQSPQLMPHVSLLQFVIIAQKAGWQFRLGNDNVLRWHVPPASSNEPNLQDGVNEAKKTAKESLDTLIHLIETESERYEERRVLATWNKYVTELKANVHRAKGDGSDPVTPEEWRERLQNTSIWPDEV